MDGWVDVGRVLGPHGVGGRVKVEPHSGTPTGILGVGTLRLLPAGASPPEGREFEVVAAQRAGRCAVFSLKGIDSPEGAAAWAGAAVSVPRHELPPPGPGEYYWVDLVGCAARRPDGTPVGTVEGVEEGPAHDWLRIRCASAVSGREEEKLLPFVEKFIREVDVAGRRLIVSPPEGW